MSFRLINTKGLIGHTSWSAVLTNHALSLLHEARKTLPESDPRGAAWDAVLSQLDRLPTGTAFMSYKPDDQPGLTASKLGYMSGVSYGYGQVPCRCIAEVSTFTTSSAGNVSPEDMPSNPAQWGWDTGVSLLKLEKDLASLVAYSRKNITVDAGTFKRSKVLQKKLANNEFSVKENNPGSDLGEVEACVLYIPNDHAPGYLDGRGNISPLSGARLFESAHSARTTQRSRRYTDAVVVHVKAFLTKIDPDHQHSGRGNTEPLQAAIAHIDRKRIEEALEEASMDQLRAKIAQMEDKLKSAGLETAPEPEPEAPRKKRM